MGMCVGCLGRAASCCSRAGCIVNVQMCGKGGKRGWAGGVDGVLVWLAAGWCLRSLCLSPRGSPSQLLHEGEDEKARAKGMYRDNEQSGNVCRLQLSSPTRATPRLWGGHNDITASRFEYFNSNIWIINSRTGTPKLVKLEVAMPFTKGLALPAAARGRRRTARAKGMCRENEQSGKVCRLQ